eukprot:GFUD01035164.1.p1 GENE.GFUD01035164.1~~GFUD01035164.1.p1  ORF type:complete len:226 (-),score=73.89 GFUD01035164.1:120-797(-)
MTHQYQYQSSTIPGLLSSYLQTITDQFSDVTLECEGHTFSCHKIILSVQSKFFTSLFSNRYGGDRSSPSVFQLPGLTKTGLEQAINFLYSRPMHLTISNVWKVVKDADFLMLDAVVYCCSNFLLSTLRPGNCLGIWAMADKYNMDSLSVKVEEFVMFHIREIARTEEFLAMDFCKLVRVLGDDRLVVRRCRLASAWIQGNMDKREQVETVLKSINRGKLPDVHIV